MNEPSPAVFRFLEFALDAANAQLRRGDEVVALRPKALAVLQHLASRPGRLVTKAELLETVWADTLVGEWVLTGCIGELRQALADDPRTPRVIETAHRQGYRFIAPIEGREVIQSLVSRSGAAPAAPAVSHDVDEDGPTLVGRTDALTVLTTALEQALRGRRQLVLIAGEAGIGKTTLVDAFCAGIRADAAWIARGQCLPHYGEMEPYLAVLEAFTRLAGGPMQPAFRASLRQHAPAWLVQIPSLLDPSEAAELQRSLAGTTRERMLREATGLVEVLERPLVLVLEDLHWCDYATLDLLAAVALRRDPAALLVIGTFRPAEAIVREHPLKAVVQDLAARGACRRLWLGNLEAHEVSRYVDLRCPGLGGDDLARVLHDRTDGHPLFLRSVMDALVERGALACTDGRWAPTVDVSDLVVEVPDDVAQMIQRQVDQLAPADRATLEAASIVGRKVSAAAVAAALDANISEVDDRLDALARRGPFLRSNGETAWPDGTLASAYEITHSLYQKVLHDGLPRPRRRDVHRRIADRLESAFVDRRDEIAADLAFHLEEAREVARAVPYLQEVAIRAVARGANREAVAVLRRALGMLDGLPPSPERTLRTIRTSLALGMSLQALDGFGHPDVERTFERARMLSTESDDVPQLFQVLAALIGNRLSRAELARARADADLLDTLAARMPFPVVRQATDVLVGLVCYHMGPLSEARLRLERSLAIEDSPDSMPIPLQFRVFARPYLGMVRLHEGHPDAARACFYQAAEPAATTTPYERAHLAMMRCYLCVYLHDLDALEAEALNAIDLGREFGARLAVAVGKIGHGRVLAARGAHDTGLAAIREGIAEHHAVGQLLAQPMQLAMLAEALADADRRGEALATIAEARARIDMTGDVRYLAELHRLEGELRAHAEEPAAEGCFERAIAIAREQGSRWWELRARTTLVEWRRAHRKPVDQAEFATFVAAFGEGEATVDVRAARRAASA